MIHRRKGRKLKRTASHRAALLSNLSIALIQNKKITTTLAKAKELRGYIDKLVTKSRKAYSDKDNKDINVHYRREASKHIRDRAAIKTLFKEIAPKVADGPGGYTRGLKLGRRSGDSAEMAVIEFVDYNEAQTGSPQQGETAEKKKSPLRRRKKATEKTASKKEKPETKKEKAAVKPKTRKKKVDKTAE
jgi:large subunit ribosomal protein L17